MAATVTFGSVGAATMQPASLQVPATNVREAQLQWAAQPIRARLGVLRRARHLLSGRTAELCAAIPPNLARNSADTLIAEVLPLLEASRFLERRAPAVLRTRTLGRRGLPWWLGSLSSRIERVPFGHILVIAPANYPLFLPGVQVFQALAAGNAAVWKPGTGGRRVAEVVALALRDAGLPEELLTVTEDSPEAARDALAGVITGARPDKVVLTGSFDTGREVLRYVAESAIPCVLELSGCDAVIALPSADFLRLAEALAFGMRFNGSATCMAPRRLFLLGFTSAQRDAALSAIRTAFSQVHPIRVAQSTAERLTALLQSAREDGAVVTGGVVSDQTIPLVAPTLITGARETMEIARGDIFAPVLSVLSVADLDRLLHAEAACPYALASAIFGSEQDALVLARHLQTGTVVINDLIVPTADPRLPFTGRRRSGFGSTRGAEGLLEMTTPRVTTTRRGDTRRQFQPTGPDHVPFFDGMIRFTHAATVRERLSGLRQLIGAARKLQKEHS